ncbi:flavodoxin [Aeromicrobium sp. Root495]|uniref:flavodoxin family protein n=1 Tax=Aeromicrobium sp. Root495 TaxID=1736550 RepID=UPI0006F8AA53|nr:hypothetical protein [Aeromicrobium sp. Root495]KQY58816.1 flavodoxin [Aeromicrobium sp. Root495]
MPSLLIVHHAPTPATRLLAESLVAGAGDEAIEGVEVVALPPDEVSARHVNDADGIVILSPANFGYMAGLVKDLFDRTFLEIGGALSDDGSGAAAQGRKPYGLCVHGRYDTEGAVRSLQSIAQALPWSQAAAPLEIMGDVTEEHRAAAYELGATLAAVVMP